MNAKDKEEIQMIDLEAARAGLPPPYPFREETKRSLIRKVSEIMGEVSRVAKNGRNDFHKYDYATESDIAEAVRSGMATRGLALFPSVEKTEFTMLETGKGGKMRLCTLTVCFTLEDSESGETRQFRIIGEGSDTGDKASYKAMTGAEKYALMKLFLIPTGDDPEREEAPKAAPRAAVREVQNPETGEVVELESPPAAAGPKVPFDIGNGRKGDPLSALDDPSLKKLGDYALKSMNNPEKAKYKRSNSELLAAIQAEQQRRQGKSQTFQADPEEDQLPF